MRSLRGKGFFAGKHSVLVEGADRKTVSSLVYPAFDSPRLSERSMGCARPPNKAPEPTGTSDTPRAFSRMTELKHPSEKRNAARGAPAVPVAHL